MANITSYNTWISIYSFLWLHVLYIFGTECFLMFNILVGNIKITNRSSAWTLTVSQFLAPSNSNVMYSIRN